MRRLFASGFLTFGAAALAPLLLGGCLFFGEEDVSFRVGFHGSLDTLHAYEAGVATQVLGVGVESWSEPDPAIDEDFASLYNENTLALFPEAKDPWAWHRASLDSPMMDTAIHAYDPDYEPQRMLAIHRDSTATGILKPGLLLGSLEPERRYKGMPCTFSAFKGEVWDSTSKAGLPLVVKSVAFRKTGGILRVSAWIDTAASRVQSPTVDFSQDVYVSMRISCP
jgi:hypothetical protein